MQHARARSWAEAAYARIRNQAVRDARIAWTDVDALTTAAAAIEANYIASRTARDVLLERFRVARGSLIDVLAAEDNFFQVAARYVQVMAEPGCCAHHPACTHRRAGGCHRTWCTSCARTGRSKCLRRGNKRVSGPDDHTRDPLYSERPPRFAQWLTEPIRANRPTYLKVAVAAAVINLFGLVTSLFTMTVYDRVVPNQAIESLVALSIGLAIITRVRLRPGVSCARISWILPERISTAMSGRGCSTGC